MSYVQTGPNNFVLAMYYPMWEQKILSLVCHLVYVYQCQILIVISILISERFILNLTKTSYFWYSIMGPKREVPGPLKAILEWDIAATEKIVKTIDQNYGPISKYEKSMKSLEVRLIFSCNNIFILNLLIINW